jgi:hypothetical protein
MSRRKLKKWPGKKVHRGKYNRNAGSWSGKFDDRPVRAKKEVEEYLGGMTERQSSSLLSWRYPHGYRGSTPFSSAKLCSYNGSTVVLHASGGGSIPSRSTRKMGRMGAYTDLKSVLSARITVRFRHLPPLFSTTQKHMGWSGGSSIMSSTIDIMNRYVKDPKVREKIYLEMIEVLENEDADCLYECVGEDIIYDKAFSFLHPEDDEDESIDEKMDDDS